MFTEFPARLSKKHILSVISQEMIMERYSGVPLTKKRFRSPMRDDRNPSCSYYRAPDGTLYIKDFSTGESFDCIKVVMRMLGCNYGAALRTIARDFFVNMTSEQRGMIAKPAADIRLSETRIRVQTREFNDADLQWWGQYGISKQMLQAYGVYACYKVFLNGQLFAMDTKRLPIYGYYFGMKNGVEYWKIYFPKNKTQRFINNCPSGLLQGETQLKDNSPVLVVTKSMKDVMTLRSHKIQAVAPSSESTFVTPEKFDAFRQRFDNIVVFYDNDLAGVHGMAKIRKRYPDLWFAMIPRDTGCKDISDYEKANGHEKTHELIKTYIQWLRRKKKAQSS